MLGKVVLLIMIITFLQVIVEWQSTTHDLHERFVAQDIFYVGAGIAFMALALKWSHEGGHDSPQDIARSTMKDRLLERARSSDGSD